MFVFQIKLIKLFPKLLSKTFAYKIERFREVLQVITHQPRATNLFFLQVYLESTVSKRKCLCFGLWEREREREREKEREEKTGMTKEDFWKISFFTFSLKSSKYLEILGFSKTLSKKEAIELICLCVTQWRWRECFCFIFLKFHMLLWLITAVYYTYFLLFIFMWKTKEISSRRTLTKTTRLFYRQQIFGSLALLT